MKFGYFFGLSLALCSTAFAAGPVEETPLPKYEPVAADIPQRLSVSLNFSEKQQSRISEIIADEVDRKITRLYAEYAEAAVRTVEARRRLGAVSFEMYKTKALLFADLRAVLAPQQQEQFDKMLYAGYFGAYQPQTAAMPEFSANPPDYTEEVKEITVTAPDGKKIIKRTIIRRKKKPAEAAPDSAAAAEPKAPEPEPAANTYP